MNINEMVNGLSNDPDNIKLGSKSSCNKGGAMMQPAPLLISTEEVSPGKVVGEGLFSTMMPSHLIKEKDYRNAASEEDHLSSEEENLIAQSSFEIRNILAHKQVTPAFMSRFAPAAVEPTTQANAVAVIEAANNFSMMSESMLSVSDNDGVRTAGENEAPRRLRIFHDITQRSAGKSNET